MKVYMFKVKDSKSSPAFRKQKTLRSHAGNQDHSLHVVHASSEAKARRQLAFDFGMGRCPNVTLMYKALKYQPMKML